MKFIDEYRDGGIAQKLIGEIRRLLKERDSVISLMEVCGTHTMNMARAGIRRLFEGNIRFLSGPGCPVCVTPNNFLDRAIALSKRSDVIIATFGDMLKVPGSRSSLYLEKSRGGQIMIVYSPLDALHIAGENPDKKIVFLGVGFETTAPTVAATIQAALNKDINNFYVLCGHKLVPPAMKMLVLQPDLKIDGFLCPGHVSAIIGSKPYGFIAGDYRIPCAIAGFEPLDILEGILILVKQIVLKETPRVDIQYSRTVKEQGNPLAVQVMQEVFEEENTTWRGLGAIPKSGLKIRHSYSRFDALLHIPCEVEESFDHPECLCGQILKAVRTPPECPLFRKKCDPENPLGPCMVSTEGTCAAWYKYGG
jgi:hydrogenase expression/formation protein HypD